MMASMFWVRAFDKCIHIGPPPGLNIPPQSPLFQTRCGLEASDAVYWASAPHAIEISDICEDCLRQGGLA